MTSFPSFFDVSSISASNLKVHKINKNWNSESSSFYYWLMHRIESVESVCRFSLNRRKLLVHFCTSWDMLVKHNQMQLFFPFFMVYSTDQHTTRINSHHRTRGEIGDCKQGFPYQLLRLIVSMNSAQNRSICTRSIVKSELYELFRLLDSFTLKNFYSSKIGPAEGFKVNKVREKRFNFNLRKINFFGLFLFFRNIVIFQLFRCFFGFGDVCRFHCGDY